MALDLRANDSIWSIDSYKRHQDGGIENHLEYARHVTVQYKGVGHVAERVWEVCKIN